MEMDIISNKIPILRKNQLIIVLEKKKTGGNHESDPRASDRIKPVKRKAKEQNKIPRE